MPADVTGFVIRGVAGRAGTSGWAVGASHSATVSGGIVLLTTDGGESWFRIPGSNTRMGGFMRSHGSRNRERRRGLTSRPLAVVWLLVLALCLPGCDGGDGSNDNDTAPSPSATSVAPTPTPTPSAGDARAVAVGAVSVATEDESGVIVRSNADGTEWSVVKTTGGFLNAVHFSDTQNGWAVGQGAGILHTSDGGTSWSQQRLEPGEDLRDVAFVSARRGVVVGGAPPVLPNPSGGSLVLLTDDAGATWNVVRLPAGPAIERGTLMSVCFLPDGTGLTFGEGTSGGVTLLTRDSGATWTDISAPFDGSGLAASACVGESDLWAVGNVPSAFHSADRGGVWEDRSEPLRAVFAGQLFSIVFVDVRTAWAAGLRTIGSPSTVVMPIVLHATDGGRSWREQTLPALADPAALNSVSFTKPGSFGVAVGELSVISDFNFPVGFVTTDGGVTWGSISFPTEVGLLRDVAALR